jgi:hypothetical protein
MRVLTCDAGLPGVILLRGALAFGYFATPARASASLLRGVQRVGVWRGAAAALNITGPITVEAWVKTTSTAQQRIQRFNSYGGGSVNGGVALLQDGFFTRKDGMCSRRHRCERIR